MEYIEHPDISAMERYGEVRRGLPRRAIFFDGLVFEADNEEYEEEEENEDD